METDSSAGRHETSFEQPIQIHARNRVDKCGLNARDDKEKEKTTALLQSLTWTTEDSLKNFLRRPLRKVRSIKA